MDASVIGSAIMSEGFKLALVGLMDHLKKKSSKYNSSAMLDPNKVYSKAIAIENVKTIWQVDRAVNLNNFYYPSKIQVDDKKVKISCLKDLPQSCKVIIQGTAGQGKSIFLRYLTGQELRTGDRVPIFVELRKISNRKNIQNLIVESLNDIGINTDTSTLEYFFESGKASILLDAFDEIAEDQIIETLGYLENLCTRYHNLQIIISSRPNAEIQKLPAFNVYNLCIITPSDFRPILDKFFDEPETVEEIVSSIHKSAKGIADIITTPLLLTLLTITYKGYNKIPESPHEFYEKLFPLLVHRHDSTKPGFVREYKSQLNEHQLEKLFHAFCFYCSLSNKVTLSRKEAFREAENAEKITKIKAESQVSFMRDCVSNTCLVVEEGYEFHFIHKSIREYHAAKFISDRGISLKQKFYNKAAENYHQYKEELKYLAEIDSDDFIEFFKIPEMKKFLSFLNWDGENVRIEKSELSSIIIMIQKETTGYSINGGYNNKKSILNQYIDIFDILFFSAMKYIESKENINEIDEIWDSLHIVDKKTDSRRVNLKNFKMIDKVINTALVVKCIGISEQLKKLEMELIERENSF